MAHNVNLPGGQHQLAYITALEKAFLRNQGPYANELQSTLPEYNGVQVMRNPGEAGGPTGGGGGDGDLEPGLAHFGGVATTGTGRSGYGGSRGGQIGSPGDDPRASEGGGEVIQAPSTSGTTTTTTNGTNGTSAGGTDTPAGPTEAELLADRIEDAMNAISSLFAGREGVYKRARDASFDLSKSGIMDSYGKAKRRLDFQMLRQGLETGQPDIDLRADLSKVMNDSISEAIRHADRVPLNMRTADAAKWGRANTAALSGRLTPGQARNMVGTLSAGVPEAWGGISDIGWNIPTGFAPSGYGGFTPDWRSRDTGAYFGSLS